MSIPCHSHGSVCSRIRQREHAMWLPPVPTFGLWVFLIYKLETLSCAPHGMHPSPQWDRKVMREMTMWILTAANMYFKTIWDWAMKMLASPFSSWVEWPWGFCPFIWYECGPNSNQSDYYSMKSKLTFINYQFLNHSSIILVCREPMYTLLTKSEMVVSNGTHWHHTWTFSGPGGAVSNNIIVTTIGFECSRNLQISFHANCEAQIHELSLSILLMIRKIMLWRIFSNDCVTHRLDWVKLSGPYPDY